jgi:hypothetical protein
MSGSGDKGSWVPKNSDACETLTQVLPLNSPNQAVLNKIRKGNLLDVVAMPSNGVVLVYALFQGEIAGSITSTIFQRIAECIEQGFSYVAEVVEIQGGVCKVKIRVK